MYHLGESLTLGGADVSATRMKPYQALTELNRTIIACVRCPRLVAYRTHVAQVKRRAYRHETYWGKPVPGFGDPQARLLIVGLAPAAHGGNRTGRAFTGDGAGRFLIRALYAAGFANQPYTLHPNDGLQLIDAYITAVVRCAPPANRPTSEEVDRCRDFLVQELARLTRLRVILTLGQVATVGFLKAWRQWRPKSLAPRVRFQHGGVVSLDATHTLVMSYHPSRQNTQTGRLTMAMMMEVMAKIHNFLTKA